MNAAVLLLTGLPGVGKTTVVERAAGSLVGWRLRGFVTREIRVAGRRVGFALESLEGGSTVLAHEAIASPHRVGRYGVDLDALDRVVAELVVADTPADLFVVDEIGSMECLSPRFVAAVRALLDHGRPLLATVALRGAGFVAAVKRRPGAEVWEVTRANRDALPDRIVERLGGRPGREGA